MTLSKVQRDLTKLTVAEYKSANEELQRRIKDLQEEAINLKRENGDLQTSHNKLFAEVKDLKAKITYKEEVIRRYQLDGNITSTRAKPIKKVSKPTSKPQQVANRKKLIHGILMNKTRYKLNDWEVEFLTNIKDLAKLFPKQYSKLQDIKKRVK
jgi:FtsZ-binding cell division protein ZapB